jgi:hypothetical protein
MQLQRLELKYQIRDEVALAVRDFVSSYLEVDEFGATRPNLSYPVHSLYLDSPTLRTFHDTINGNKNRFKPASVSTRIPPPRRFTWKSTPHEPRHSQAAGRGAKGGGPIRRPAARQRDRLLRPALRRHPAVPHLLSGLRRPTAHIVTSVG